MQPSDSPASVGLGSEGVVARGRREAEMPVLVSARGGEGGGAVAEDDACTCRRGAFDAIMLLAYPAMAGVIERAVDQQPPQGWSPARLPRIAGAGTPTGRPGEFVAVYAGTALERLDEDLALELLSFELDLERMLAEAALGVESEPGEAQPDR